MRGFAANLGLLWTDRPLLDRIAAAGRAGFDAIEMHWPYDTDPGHLRQAAASHGLTVLGVNTPPGRLDEGELGFAAVPGHQEQFREGLHAALDYCRQSGASAIHVMAGNVAPAERPKALDLFVENLVWGAQVACGCGVTLLIEPLNGRDHPDYAFGDVEVALNILGAVGQDNVKLQFDSYHLAMQGADPADVLQRAISSIGNVQFAAMPDRAEPDHGQVDHSDLVHRLLAMPYAGWISGEYRPRGATDEGLGWLAELRAVVRGQSGQDRASR